MERRAFLKLIALAALAPTLPSPVLSLEAQIMANYHIIKEKPMDYQRLLRRILI